MVAPLVSTVFNAHGGQVFLGWVGMGLFNIVVRKLVLNNGIEMYHAAKNGPEEGKGLRKLAAIATIVAGCAIVAFGYLMGNLLFTAGLSKLGFLIGGPVGATVGLVTGCALAALGLVIVVVDISLHIATGKNIATSLFSD